MVALSGPPPTRPVRPVWHVVSPGRQLRRIWNPGALRYAATDFRSGEPKYRFDHHQEADSNRAILYAAYTVACCVVEKYGDIGALEPNSDRCAILEVIDEMRLLDLRGAAAQQAGTVAAIGSVPDVAFTQAWSRYYYAAFPSADGLMYNGAHNAQDAMALYERARSKIRLDGEFAMSDPRMRYALMEACELKTSPSWHSSPRRR